MELLFWLCIICLGHSYLFYPLLLKWLARNKQANQIVYKQDVELPFVSAIIAIYNEEMVIKEKLLSLLSSNYPKEKLTIYAGSDGSTDDSNAIVSRITKQAKNLKFFNFQERSGKPGVVNKLVEIIFSQRPASPDHILLMTDANVLLLPDSLRHLVKHFKKTSIAVVDANMIHTGQRHAGISFSESQYLRSEVMLKHHEAILNGKMIGPFGGCYALRSTYFSKVPDNFLVDDFFITMKALEKGVEAINDMDAICYEPVSHEMKEEYRRKSRISAGNFQNLIYFTSVFRFPFSVLALQFFSHKVLRWLGPFFIIFALISSGILAFKGNLFYTVLFGLQITVWFGAPLLDYLFKQFKINLLIVRNVSYFTIMNVALLEGFIKYLKGIKNNAWDPPKRR